MHKYVIERHPTMGWKISKGSAFQDGLTLGEMVEQLASVHHRGRLHYPLITAAQTKKRQKRINQLKLQHNGELHD